MESRGEPEWQERPTRPNQHVKINIRRGVKGSRPKALHAFRLNPEAGRGAVSLAPKPDAMHAHEIFQSLTPKCSTALFEHLYTADKPAYRATLQILAARRKLRPQFVERKPRLERDQWLHDALTKKLNEDASLEVLQAWLLGAHRDLICTFLNQLEVPHDGKGLIENLPSEPDSTKLDAAIETLLTKFDQEVVAIYLQLFFFMEPERWPKLGEKLSADTRLQLAPLQALAS